MESLAAPLRILLSDASWFARAHEVRLLHAECDLELLPAAIETMRAMEAHADNQSSWYVLEDAQEKAEDGWRPRAVRLVAQHEERRAALAPRGIVLGAASIKANDETPGLSLFASALGSVVAAQRPPLHGVVIVLAPTRIEDLDAFHRVLEVLMVEPAFSKVRWVTIEPKGAARPQALLRALGDQALETTCIAREGDVQADLDALVSSASVTAPGRPPRIGVVGPARATRPRRKNENPAPPLEQVQADLAKAGISPQFAAGVVGPKIQALLLGGMLAMRQGRGPEAIRQQREARDLMRSVGMEREAVIVQMVLANCVATLGHHDLAVQELGLAIKHASSAQLPSEEGHARLALGHLHHQKGQLLPAAREFSEAGKAAERGGAAALAIEAFRLAGQIAVDAGAEQPALAAFGEALRIAGAAPPEIAKHSTAAEAARQLASHVRKRGLEAQARSLEEQAAHYERGGKKAVDASSHRAS